MNNRNTGITALLKELFADNPDTPYTLDFLQDHLGVNRNVISQTMSRLVDQDVGFYRPRGKAVYAYLKPKVETRRAVSTSEDWSVSTAPAAPNRKAAAALKVGDVVAVVAKLDKGFLAVFEGKAYKIEAM